MQGQAESGQRRGEGQRTGRTPGQGLGLLGIILMAAAQNKARQGAGGDAEGQRVGLYGGGTEQGSRGLAGGRGA